MSDHTIGVGSRYDGWVQLSVYEDGDHTSGFAIAPQMAHWLLRELALVLRVDLAAESEERPAEQATLPDLLKEMQAKFPATFRAHGFEALLAADSAMNGGDE